MTTAPSSHSIPQSYPECRAEPNGHWGEISCLQKQLTVSRPAISPSWFNGEIVAVIPDGTRCQRGDPGTWGQFGHLPFHCPKEVAKTNKDSAGHYTSFFRQPYKKQWEGYSRRLEETSGCSPETLLVTIVTLFLQGTVSQFIETVSFPLRGATCRHSHTLNGMGRS